MVAGVNRVNPSVGPGTHSQGFSHKSVIITGKTDDGRFACKDNFGKEILVNASVQRAKGLPPEVGERWMIARDLGGWTFAACLSVPQEPPSAGPKIVSPPDNGVWLAQAGTLSVTVTTNALAAPWNYFVIDPNQSGIGDYGSISSDNLGFTPNRPLLVLTWAAFLKGSPSMLSNPEQNVNMMSVPAGHRPVTEDDWADGQFRMADYKEYDHAATSAQSGRYVQCTDSTYTQPWLFPPPVGEPAYYTAPHNSPVPYGPMVLPVGQEVIFVASARVANNVGDLNKIITLSEGGWGFTVLIDSITV